MLIDPKSNWGSKALNFATGVKIGTYDLPLQKLYEIERTNRELIQEDPMARAFETMYIPKAKKDRADKKTLEALKLNQKMAKLIKKLNEERKAASPVQ